MYSKRKIRPNEAIANKIKLVNRLTFLSNSINLSNLFSNLNILSEIIIKKYTTEEANIKISARSEADLSCLIP
ncbi:hypothetical protein COY15_00885 [Candidatus Roizmanbacteria bacterium CG_4_10_14_0_2_um_filter_39_12]|nr:MAG: hypothetical protein COY15_00885 [Candidatus Roizmanbacteria bacterium CG_4_10_14_0_2_um_filter_39_12]